MLLIAASILWSLSGLFMKSPPMVAMPVADRVMSIACYRALFAAACLLPFVNWRRVRWRVELIPMVFCFATMNFLFVSATTRTTAAVAIFLQYTATGWAFLFGLLFLRERLTRMDLVSLTFAFSGIAIIVGGQWSDARVDGALLAIGSGCAYAGVVVSLRNLRAEDSAWLIVLNLAFSGLLLLPVALSRGLAPTPQQWMILGVLGSVQLALPYWLFARGVSTVSAGEASLITLLEPILNPVWVMLFWPEREVLTTWLGGGIILVGLVVRYLPAFANRDSASRVDSENECRR